MNYNREFTKEEFLALPLYPSIYGVPANTDFLLGEDVEMEREGQVGNFTAGRMASQKNALLHVLEDVTKANTDLTQTEQYLQIMKVRYWRAVKGKKDASCYVQERGGHITMKSIIDSIKPNSIIDMTNLIPETNATIEIEQTQEQD